MPRGIPNAKPAAGSAPARSDNSVWDAFAAAALTGMLQRGNQSSDEVVAAAGNAADKMMAERAKRFGQSAASEDDAA